MHGDQWVLSLSSYWSESLIFLHTQMHNEWKKNPIFFRNFLSFPFSILLVFYGVFYFLSL